MLKQSDKRHKKKHWDSAKAHGTFSKRNGLPRHEREPIVEIEDDEDDALLDSLWDYPELDDTLDYHRDGLFSHEDEGYESGDFDEL